MTIINSLNNILITGKQKFGLNVGIVSHITGNKYTIAAVESDYEGFEVGSVYDIENTYCKDIVLNKKTMTFDEITEMLKHPVYLSAQLRAYIGTPIFVSGNVWGTLNFSSLKPRNPIFNEQDFKYIEYLARIIPM